MKVVKVIGAILIIVVLLAAIGYVTYITFFEEKNPPIIDVNPTNSGEENSDKTLADKVQIRAITVSNKTDNIYVDNVYPSIESFINKEFEHYINKQIANSTAEYRSEISYMVDDLTPETTLYKYTTNFEKYTWGDYLTIVINQDYQTGGIRSNTWKDLYNINARTERIIYLEDLFDATVDYESAIISEITMQAALKGYKLMGGDGLKKLPTKQSFYIRDAKLIIYFDPSEIAASEYGELNFEMPFKLDENGFFEIN